MAERQSSTSSRPSRRSRTSCRSSNPDIFSDEFALDPFEISNGSGPPLREGDGFVGVASTTRPHDNAERSITQQHLPGSIRGRSRRSTGSQRLGGRYSSSSTTSPFPLQSTDIPNGASTPHRSISSISTSTIPRTQSPYQGATGPSQPYGLYPQDIGISRTPSTATTSTVRMPERIYTGPVGPTQPYSMYPQNTVPEDEVSPVDGINPAPVGFPGLSQDYRRRFGPDGEEVADLVGPDGHTEQLPPYTRYPNDLPPKDANPSIPPTALSAVSPVSPIATQGNHPEASQDTLTAQDTLVAAQSNISHTRSPTVDDSSTELNQIPTNAPAQPDESGNFKESVSEKSKRRVCWDRLPIWAVVLLLLVVGILIGSVIGGILGHKAGQEKATESLPSLEAAAQAAAPSTVFVTTTSLVDAVPVTATPSDLPPLPTGLFAIKLGSPSLADNSCLSNKTQGNAWQCANGTDLNFEILPGCQFSLLGPDSNAPIRYGAQPPQLPGPTNMSLMNDRAGRNKGPAFFFQQAFDKVVVVRESDFAAISTKRSFRETGEYDEFAALEDRDVTQYGSPDLIATPPNRPWFCFWNGTILEGFIFVTLDSNSINASTSTSSPASDQPPFGSNPIPSLTSAGPLGASSKPGSWSKRAMSLPTNLASFPKIVKIEERRNARNPVQPYCQQMQILYTNMPGNLRDSTGQLIMVNLTENESLPEESLIEGPQRGPPSRRRSWHLKGDEAVERRDTSKSQCGCQWLSS